MPEFLSATLLDIYLYIYILQSVVAVERLSCGQSYVVIVHFESQRRLQIHPLIEQSAMKIGHFNCSLKYRHITEYYDIRLRSKSEVQ